MKILHIELQTKTGGVASLVYDLCSTQVEAGNDVTVLTWFNDDIYLDQHHKLEKKGVKTLKSKYNGKYNISKIQELRNLFFKYDVVHIHLFPIQLYAAIACKLIPKNKRPVLITTEHNTYNNRRKYKILRYFDRWVYSIFDKIICISEQTSINLCKWLDNSILSKKICTINNGINLKKYSQAKCEDLPFTKNQNTKYLVMVSRMCSPKDPVCIVKALQFCDQSVHLVLIGAGPLVDEVKKTASTLNISHRIHLLGNISNVENYLKNFDIGILSTNWDGFGLVAVEYMAAGLPVLASDVDGLRDVIGRKEYLFNKGDYQQLADRINHLLYDKTYYNRSKKFFYDNALLYSCERMGLEYMKIYDNLVKSNYNGQDIRMLENN